VDEVEVPVDRPPLKGSLSPFRPDCRSPVGLPAPYPSRLVLYSNTFPAAVATRA
jgi:hypothetical protein